MTGELVGPGVELAIGEALLLVAHRHRVGRALRLRREQRMQALLARIGTLGGVPVLEHLTALGGVKQADLLQPQVGIGRDLLQHPLQMMTQTLDRRPLEQVGVVDHLQTELGPARGERQHQGIVRPLDRVLHLEVEGGRLAHRAQRVERIVREHEAGLEQASARAEDVALHLLQGGVLMLLELDLAFVDMAQPRADRGRGRQRDAQRQGVDEQPDPGLGLSKVGRPAREG